MRTRKEEETESRKQWTSPRMCHSSVTLIQQVVSRQSDSSPAHPFQMRMHSRRALWEEYAFYAIDGIIDKLACLRIWRTYILQSTKKKTKQTCHEIMSNHETITKKNTHGWNGRRDSISHWRQVHFLSSGTGMSLMCIEENGLASTWLSVNSTYIAKIIQMLFISTQCSDQPIGKT